LLNYRSYVYVLDINPLSEIRFSNIFCPSRGHLSTLTIVSFDAQKFYIFIKYNLSIFFLLSVLLMSYTRNCGPIHQIQIHEIFFPCL
jgi:hypothetical protein